MHKFEKAHGSLLRLADLARTKRLGMHRPSPPVGKDAAATPPPEDDSQDSEMGEALSGFAERTPPPMENPKKKQR